MNLSETYRRRARNYRTMSWVMYGFAVIILTIGVVDLMVGRTMTGWIMFTIAAADIGLGLLDRSTARTNDRIADAWADYERWMH